MAETPYSRFDSAKVFDLTPGYKDGGGSGGGELEARLAKLESDVGYVKRDVGELRSDMRDTRDRTVKIEALVGHLPSKAFVFGAYGVVGALIVAITLFQTRIQDFIGIGNPSPSNYYSQSKNLKP
ncbi:hypothetical protein GGE68_001402 [Rhizobium leguminosarum]|uniref:hypothetical protein n=1 Tax=Rhizobium leguminosarum TaxID=384 RepID=UPI0016199A04|nr:hypothetical protein [Rhizobium leguminosarum]MBB5663226.1 hypothetical protein [Rhizobium leguminosarum]